MGVTQRSGKWGEVGKLAVFSLTALLLLGFGGNGRPPGPARTWDGPRDGTVGAPGWPSGRDGRASVAVEPPSPWVAGSYVRCCLAICPEGTSIEPGGGVRVALRRGSDASSLQSSDPTDEGYVTASALSASGQPVRVEVDPIGNQGSAAWPRAVEVRLAQGLSPGDSLLLVLGDRSRGGPGFRVQTYGEETPILRIYTDGDGDGVYGPVENAPAVRVISGGAVGFRLSAPTVVEAGEPFQILVRAEDRFWNTAESYGGALRMVLERLAGPEFWTGEPDSGTHSLRAVLAEDARWALRAADWKRGRAVAGGRVEVPGLYMLRTEGDLEPASLPLVVLGEAPRRRLFWGDLHGHTELSDGAGTADGYYAFARDQAGLDFAAATEHDWLLSAAEWKASVKAANRAYEPGRFVTFAAYEWSEKWRNGGDHNVYYVSGKPELFRCSRSASPDASSGDELLAALRGLDVLLIPHVGGRPGRWEVDAPELKTVCEIVSVHGRNERYGQLGLEIGRRVGFIGSSDGHTGHPGRSHPAPPTFAVEPGGLAAVWAEALTRESFAEAIRARRTYATTGDRILLYLEVAGAQMGSEIRREGSVEVVARVAGTAPIEAVEIHRLWRTVARTRPEARACTFRWTDPYPWKGEVCYYLRVTQTDGSMAWSSPVWIEP